MTTEDRELEARVDAYSADVRGRVTADVAKERRLVTFFERRIQDLAESHGVACTLQRASMLDGKKRGLEEALQEYKKVYKIP